MQRRSFLLAFTAVPLGVVAAADGLPQQILRGKLVKAADGRPAIETGGKPKTLTGDESTLLVLNDRRLAGSDFEVVGGDSAGGTFAVNPIHMPSLFVYRDGKRLRVTYWCDICYIRTFSPGICWCCQQETKLDPVEPDKLKP